MKSKNYKMFELLPMNRNINEKQVGVLVDSIKSMGAVTRDVVCCMLSVLGGAPKLYIIDGQHLAKALERLGMPINYQIIKVKDEIDMVKKMGQFNSTAKSWNLKNYVEAYTYYMPDYVQLLKLHNTHNIELAMLSAVCGLNPSYDSGGGTNYLKRGEFEMINPSADKWCKELNELFDLIPGIDHNLKRKIMRARIAVGNLYNHSKAIKNIGVHKNTLIMMGSEHNTLMYLQKNIFI
jgi:hypothetical protein